MKALKSLLVAFSLAAFASAYAAEPKTDTQAKPGMSQGGSASTGAGGSASAGASGSGSAGGASRAQFDFDKADKNKDGQLSRAEFDEMMKGSAAAGGTAKKDEPSATTPKPGKSADKPATSK